jgi:glycosyltransferase involved in cell wall biosynthesis
MSCTIDNVSVVVPTRNEAHNIVAFLAALHPAVELVVVDNSDDGTDQIISRVRPERTRVIRSQAHIARARQIGAEAAHGQWLIFSDADVAFTAGYFSSLTRCDLGDAFFGPKYATSVYPRYSKLFNGGQKLVHWLGIPGASGSNMGMRREVFRQAGGFWLDLPVNEDTELMIRLKHQGYRVNYVRDLAVRSLDDRRLKSGVMRKYLHSLARNTLLLVDLRFPLPVKWLTHDWGYWREGVGGTSPK